MQRQTNRFVLFACIAFLTFAEAFFTHFGGIRTLSQSALTPGLSPGMARLRLGLLGAWDVVAALGAGLVTAGVTRFLRPVWISRGIRLTLTGLLGYALSQIGLAFFVLSPPLRVRAWGMAALYLGLGALAWFYRQ